MMWMNNMDVLYRENDTIEIIIKFMKGAPRFSNKEFQMWEESFNDIGIVKVGYWPKPVKAKRPRKLNM
jgi:hypothetical protein